ncbi:MAG: biotin/lipoyl-containing protein [Chloroflexota bacterium]
MKYIARVAEREYAVEVAGDNTVSINGQTYKVDARSIDGDQIYSFLMGDHSYEMFVNRTETGYDILVAGERHEITVEDEYTQRLTKLGGTSRGPKSDAQVKAPMPGLVVAVRASEGDRVTSGQGLLILEAMKMENELRAPWNGTIKSVKVAAGQKVEQGQLLMVIAAE